MGKAKKPKLSHKDAVWFRKRFIDKDDECRELRKTLERFGIELSQGGLVGQLIAKELFLRIARVPER